MSDRALKSRSQVITKALELLHEQKLEAACALAVEAVDLNCEVTVTDDG